MLEPAGFKGQLQMEKRQISRTVPIVDGGEGSFELRGTSAVTRDWSRAYRSTTFSTTQARPRRNQVVWSELLSVRSKHVWR